MNICSKQDLFNLFFNFILLTRRNLKEGVMSESKTVDLFLFVSLPLSKPLLFSILILLSLFFFIFELSKEKIM